MFRRIKSTDGFTLVELLMVMIIIGILTQVAFTFTIDLRKRAFDATALTDGKNLLSVVGNSFLALDDVTFEHTAVDGQNVGVLTADGFPRATPVFTLSPGVKAEILHDDPGVPSGGYVSARLYHERGTNDGMTSSGKREFWFSIDEITSSISAPTL